MKIKRRTFASVKKWMIRFTIVSVLLSIFFVYTRTQIFTITSYDIQGVDDLSRAQIVADLDQVTKKKVYFIIPGNKIFTYSNSAVIAAVRTTVTDLATIDIRPVGLHRVRIDVTLLTPLFKVHNDNAITENGIIFKTTKDISKYPQIVIASSTEEIVKVHGLPFTQVMLNKKKIDPLFLQDLVMFSSNVSSIIFLVTSILVEETGDITLFNASATSKVMFLKDMDQKKVWSTLVSAIDTDPLKSKLATEKEKLEYLDVRYGNKIFYRFSNTGFQNKGSAVIIDNHATTSQAARVATTSVR